MGQIDSKKFNLRDFERTLIDTQLGRQPQHAIGFNSRGQLTTMSLTDIQGHSFNIDNRADYERNKRLSNGPVVTLYHQTNRDSADKIVRSGKFRCGNDGLCGGGIYFAQCPSDTHLKAHEHGVILKVRVRLGNTKTVRRQDKSITLQSLLREGHDSVRLEGRDSGVEYVVYSHDQICDIRAI